MELFIRWGIGGIFVFASVHKIIHPDQFAAIIKGYQLFPLVTIHPLAVFVPFLEMICGAALIVGVFPRGAITIINIMLLMFILAISINLLRGHEFDCGCFSFASNATASVVHLLIRDLICLAGGIYIMWFQGRRPLSAENIFSFKNKPLYH
jgi:putative oxidoreductase